MRSHLLLFRGLEGHDLDFLGLELFVVAGTRALDEEHIIDRSWGYHQGLVIHIQKIGHVDLLGRALIS